MRLGFRAGLEPNTRLVLSWDIDANFQYDPKLKTEIEVRFIAEEDGSTRVELEHRRLDRFGDRRAEMRDIFDKTGIGGQLLASFAQQQSLRRDRKRCHITPQSSRCSP